MKVKAVYDFTHPDKIECFDPLAMENSRKVLPTLTYCQDEYEIAEHCDTMADWLIILSLIGRSIDWQIEFDCSIGRLVDRSIVFDCFLILFLILIG